MNTIPANGLELIRRAEGCHDQVGDDIYEAYRCPAGVWTIGWGTTRNEYNEPIKQGDTATQDQVDRYLLCECDVGMRVLEYTISTLR